MEISKIICDSDFLCSFLWVNKKDLLLTLFENRLFVPAAVVEEIEALNTGRAGQFVYDDFYELLITKKIEILDINLDSEEDKLMKNIKKDLNKIIGDGELQMITLAISLKTTGYVSTGSNNLKDIYHFVEKGIINNITTMDVLCFAYDKELESLEELENIKKEMIKKKRWLPKESVESYYNSSYTK